MSLWILLIVVFVAGAVGGLVNGVMTDAGVVFPQKVADSNNKKVTWLPGYLGNMFIGSIAAAISWGLYGPFAAEYVFGGPLTTSATQAFGLTLSSLVGAVLVGIGGARWLSNEVEKTLFRTAAGTAANRGNNADTSVKIANATGRNALELANTLPAPQ
jgi:hypothetical protein